MVVISEKGGVNVAFHWDLFRLICKGVDKRTTSVRCFYDSLLKSHTSFDTHKLSNILLGFLKDVSRLSCNSYDLLSYMIFAFVSNLAATDHR